MNDIIVASAESLLVYQGGVDDNTSAWWNGHGDGQPLLAEDDARRYESLSEQEQDAIWNEEADSIETEVESDELDLPTNQRLAPQRRDRACVRTARSTGFE